MEKDLSHIKADELAAVSDVTQLAMQDTVPWYRKKNLRALYLTLVPSALGVEMTSGYDGSVLTGLQAVQPWLDYFNNPQGSILGIMVAAFSFGAVLAIPFVPWVNDRFGRKMSIILGSCFILVGVVLQTASINFGMFLGSRFVLGYGIPFAINGASQLIAELAYPKERSVITGLFNESWYVGGILAAGITLGTFSMKSNWAWRLPSLFQIIPSLLQLTFIWFVPESPRWLVSRDRSEEALAILVKYHAEGDASSPFVLAEFEQIRDTIRMEQEASKNPWREMFTSKANIRRMAIACCVGLFSQWSGNGLTGYYLAKILDSVGITSPLHQNQINLATQVWSLITGVSAAFLTKYLRRRHQYLLAYGGMTIVFASITACAATFAKDGSHSGGVGLVALLFVFTIFYNCMHPMTYIYITEVFPFISRSKGVATTQLLSRAGSAFNQYVNPIALEKLAWKFYFVYVGWLVCETTIIFFLYPETKGPTLEETAVLFEGNDAKVGLVKAAEAHAGHVEEVENI